MKLEAAFKQQVLGWYAAVSLVVFVVLPVATCSCWCMIGLR